MSKHTFSLKALALFHSICLALLALALPTPVSADGGAPTVASASQIVANKSAKDLIVTIESPTNVVELMENLRDALRSRLLFDEAFYAEDNEDNIKKMTAAEKVKFYRNQEKQTLEVGVLGFGSIAENLKSYGGGLSVRITHETLADGKKSVAIRGSISSPQPPLHYLIVEKLVGYAWQIIIPESLGSNQIYRAPTDSYGNAEREYTHQDGNIKEWGYFRFNFAGLLTNFILSSKER